MTKAAARDVVMLGTSMAAPGGITAVARAYEAGGLFAERRVRYLATYHRAGTADKLYSVFAALLQFVWWQARGEVNAVHAHVAARGSFWRKSAFLLLGRMCGNRTIFHLHDGSFPSWYASRAPEVQKLVRWILRRMDRVVVLTESWRNELQRMEPAAKCHVLVNPVVLQKTSATLEGSKVLFMGRLWPDKGIDVLMQAMAIVKSQGVAFQLTCAGDGDLDSVRRQAELLGIAREVHLPGWVEGAAKLELLQEADVFVLPSYFEGLPMGVLEAMSWGVPVVASEVGGIPEAVGKSAGLLVPPGDAHALAQALLHLLGDRTLRLKIGAAGRKRVSQSYELSSVLRSLGAIYDELGVGPIRDGMVLGTEV